MKVKLYLLVVLLISGKCLLAQYTMSNQTVYDCQGTLTDSEANSVNSGWYDNNENFSFTICPAGAYLITIDFTFFLTEPINDYVMIYDNSQLIIDTRNVYDGKNGNHVKRLGQG